MRTHILGRPHFSSAVFFCVWLSDLWGSLSYLGYLVDRCGQTTPEVSDNPEVVWSPHFRSAAAMTFLITPYEIPVILLAWLIEIPAIHIS